MAEKLDLGLVALFIFKNGPKGDEKILDDANYIEEREKKSIRSVSTLYTWELSYSLAFSVLLQASMGPDVIICVCVWLRECIFTDTDGDYKRTSLLKSLPGILFYLHI